MRVSGTTAHSSVDLNVTVQWNVTADESGSFSELVDMTGIPAGDYGIRAADGTNTATTQTAISAPADAMIALQIAVGIRPFDAAADVSGDGKVSSLDALINEKNRIPR